MLSKTRVPAAQALANVEVSVVLTTDKKIRAINKKWRGKDRATDVLSFPQFSTDELKKIGRQKPPEWPLGDIIISLDTARLQAKKLGFSLQEELDRLLAHGLLHLLGFDHEIDRREARRMQRLERILLTR